MVRDRKRRQERKKFLDNCRRIIFDELRKTALTPVKDEPRFFVDVEEIKKRLGLRTRACYDLCHEAILKLRKDYQLWVHAQRKGNKIVRYAYGERTKVGRLENEKAFIEDVKHVNGHIVNLRIQAEALIRRGQLPDKRISGYKELASAPNQFLELSDQLKKQHAFDYDGQAENLIKISSLEKQHAQLISEAKRKAKDKENN